MPKPLALVAVFLFGCLTNSYAIAPPPQPPAAAVLSSDHAAAFSPAAATQAWLDSVPPEKRARSDAYFEGGYWLILWDVVLSTLIGIFLLQSRISARLRDWGERVTKSKSLQVVLYVVPFILLVSVLSFPLTVYAQFFREHQYGLATQTFLPWFGEQLIGLGIAVVAVTVVTLALYSGLRRAPRAWWFIGAFIATLFSVIGSFIAPVFIFPLFNKYTPLQDPAIREPILALARANEIPVHQVFLVDASRQTTRVSANVAGVFGTTRIALNDNLLNQCSLAEIRHVMGHEMGHFVLNHNIKQATFGAIFFLIAFALADQMFRRAHRRWGERWGIRDIADPAGLPLLWVILGVLVFLSTPLTNSVTRVMEREADAFGINTAREPDGFAAVSLKLGAYRKLNPTPLEEVIFFDHPSGRSRIRMAMDWKAAQLPAGGKD